MTYSHMPDRKWGQGHNVLAASLTSVEDDLYATSIPFRLPPAAQPIDQYPVESMMLSGRVRGDGMLSHTWEWGFMPIPTFQWYMAYWFPNGEKSVEATILERMHEWSDDYRRYNVYMIRPVPGTDYRIDGGRVVELKQRFSGLRALGDLSIQAERFVVGTEAFGTHGVFTGSLTATVLVNTQSFLNAGIGTPVEPQKFSSANVVRAPVVYNDRLTPPLMVDPDSFGAHSVGHGVSATVHTNSQTFGTPVVTQ